MKKVVLFLSLVFMTLSMFAQNSPELVCATPYVAAIPLDATSAGVVWNSTAAATYSLQYRGCTDTAWTSVNSLTAGTGVRDTGYYIIRNLTSCKCYVVRLRANCSATESSDWRSFEFRTIGCVEPCRAPAQLFAASRDTTASLNWSPMGTGRTYLVQWKSRTETVWNSQTSSTNTLSVNRLQPCSEYQFRVKTFCSATDTSTFSEPVKFKTSGCVAPCSTPRDLRVTNSDRTTVGISWASSGATSYEVSYQVGDSAARTAIVTVAAFRLLNISTCKFYTFKVRSICGTAAAPVYSEWSAPISLLTEGCVRCEAPGRLSYTVTEAGTGATLKWDTIRGTSIPYDVQWMGPRDTTWRTVANVRGSSYNLTGLTVCTWYMFRVKANCTTTTSSVWSAPIRFQTKGCPAVCVAPKNLKVYVADTVAIISWQGVTGVTSYKLIVTSEDGTFTREVSATGYVYTLTGLARCKKFKIQLKTVCSATLTSEVVNGNFETKGCPTPCTAPVELKDEVVNDTTVNLKFNMIPGQSYTVQYRVAGATTWVSRAITTTTPNNEPIKITGLLKCTTYQWRVLRNCSATNIAESRIETFDTKGCPPPCTATPRDLVVTTSATDSAKVTWIAPTAGLTYEVRYGSILDSAALNATPIRLTTNTLTLRGLVACRNYIVMVRTICPNGQASEWVSKTFRLGTNCSANGDGEANERVQIIREFGVYPNPGSESVQVAYILEKDANVKVELMNLQGQVVNRLDGGNQEAGNYVQTIDQLGTLHNGIYMVVISANGKVVNTQKWQKQ